MGKLVLAWEPVGPAREVAVEVPPISIGNYAYVWVFDPQRKAFLYCHASDYGDATAMYAYDGAAWSKLEGKGPPLGNECHSFYDASRGGVAVWCVEHDHVLKRHVPEGALVTAKGVEAIETTGEPPLIEPDSEETFFTSSNLCCAMAYDAGREVTVCLTRRGVYELAAGAWSRIADAECAPEEWHDEATGVYDPIGKRCVFAIQGRGDGYAYTLLAWDGKTLARLPAKGLPELCMGSFDPCAQFAGHPEHGVVCTVGPRGEFALAGTSWKKLPAPKNPPPLMGGRNQTHRAQITCGLDRIAIGPAYFEGHPGGGDAQRVFWFLRGGAWEREGAIGMPSEIDKLYGRHHAVAGGTWYATNARGLHTMRWQAAGWELVVDDKTGEAAIGKERNGAIAGTPEGLVAVTQTGGVLRLERDAWKRLAKPSAAFKERTGFLVAHDGKQLIAWGGEVKNRKVNDTLGFDGKAWKPMKASSPQPNWKPKDGSFVDFAIIHDSALDRLVRFGYGEVATLEGEVWKPVKPVGYTVGARRWEHVPAHDPITGETLLVDFAKRNVLRFDLGGCVEVATFGYPKHLEENAKREHESIEHYFAEDHVFDPASRSIHSQQHEDRWARSRLDLGPAFEAAKKLGARKLLGAAKPAKAGPATLYKLAKGKVDVWRGDAKQADAKRKAGYLPAGELTTAALEVLGTRTSRELVVGKSKPKQHAVSRVGGLPSGIALDDWPEADGEPLGFLFQLVTELGKHAAVAVFCKTDGTATEDESNNLAVLLTAAELARAPVKKPPAGVPVLEERAITIAPPKPEIAEAVIEKLTAKDPELAAAFERYQATVKVQDANCASKLGGAPVWLQGAEGGADGFVGQLDFDHLRIKPDIGLAGCLYVFARGGKADAMWQYT